MPFLPVANNNLEMDFVLVSADAYIDHPSFGHAIISRLIKSRGLSVGIIAQPVKDADYLEFGAPKIGFLVSGGVVDSMVNNYTVALKRRTKDSYSEGGDYGRRPDRAVTVYTNALKRLFPGKPVIIGGIEASLRRFAHYDYWSDSVMPSILIDSGADLLVYGMGENPLSDILDLILKGALVEKIRDVRGTAFVSDFEDLSAKLKEDIYSGKAKFCPSYEDVKSDKYDYVKAFNIQNDYKGHILQKHSDKYVVVNPPAKPLTTEQMDYIYSLPYMRDYHFSYKRGVPAIEEIKFSITSHRGCFGGCNYCALNYHQGSAIQKRSKQSIIDEAEKLKSLRDFKGYIHDVGGPTANFRINACNKSSGGSCKGKSCIGYKPCDNLKVNHGEYLDILRALRQMPGIKKVFIRSGIRYDYLMYEKTDGFLDEIVRHHISGQLKVAPEHSSERVLKAMNKAPFKVYLDFYKRFGASTAKAGLKQYLVPYFISSHPACTLEDGIALAEYLNSIGYIPEQVQDFYPTPSTKSTTMYYTGINPDTMEEIYVPKTKEEKAMQRALMQFRLRSNYRLVKAALIKAGRSDLIGYGRRCLIPPYPPKGARNKK
ncbi:MAG: YgiQ family radical SAM protein [Christensenellales bacterium]|jgi:uncharacterized radical SAM protein YgiQ